jgi:hypothetical protein
MVFAIEPRILYICIVKSTIMKNHYYSLLFVFSICFATNAQQNTGKAKWTAKNIFQHDVFIENKGQFDNAIASQAKQPVLYYSHKGSEQLYFSANAITFRYDKLIKDNNESADRDADGEKFKTIPQYMSITWEGANTSTEIEVQEPVNNYFTYPNPSTATGMPSILAHAWKRLIYHNLYNGIDIVYYFPEKGGVEYDVIVHPGADISKFKMKYTGAQVKIVDGNVIISSALGSFIDHAPVARDENDNDVPALFQVNNNVVFFKAGVYNNSKQLIIDPWISSTAFSGANKAYDLQYDEQGNVYVTGGGDNSEYQLEKYNSVGSLQWSYNFNFTYAFTGKFYYGAFTTDKRSGSSYIAEGMDYSGSGCVITKVSTMGSLMTTVANTNIDEIWRMAFDYCNNQVVIGAGDGASAVYQAAIMDTACKNITPVNILGAGAGVTHHDITMMALDGVGNCYFATSKATSASYPGYDNILLQVPAVTLSPTAYQVYDRSSFYELANIPYYPVLSAAPYLYSGNGYNGLAADFAMVVTYDGNKIRKWKPATGGIIDSITTSLNQHLWGGIALDCNENIYVGDSTNVKIYDSSLVLKGTYALTDTVYDIKIDNARGTLYTCGKDFVRVLSISVTGCKDSTCNTLTGISNIVTESSSITLYPNPNNGKFTIHFDDISQSMNDCQIGIYNVLGQMIYSQILQHLKGSNEIDLSTQPKGIYLYRAQNQAGIPIYAGKVVIQ